MRILKPLYIEGLISQLLYNDQEIGNILAGWEIERDEIRDILRNYFLSMGINEVKSSRQGDVLKAALIDQLEHSPDLQRRRKEVRAQISLAREKNRTKS